MFKLGVANDLGISSKWYDFGLKGQGSRSQGHKVQKHIEDDRVAGVRYALYWVPSLYSFLRNSWRADVLQLMCGLRDTYVGVYGAAEQRYHQGRQPVRQRTATEHDTSRHGRVVRSLRQYSNVTHTLRSSDGYAIICPVLDLRYLYCTVQRVGLLSAQQSNHHSLKPGFHYPSWRAVNSTSGNRVPVNTARVDG